MIGPFRISQSWLLALPAVLLGMALEHRSGAVETPCPIGAACGDPLRAGRGPRDDRCRAAPRGCKLLALPAVLLGMALEHRSGAVETPCPIGSRLQRSITRLRPRTSRAIDVALLPRELRKASRCSGLCADRPRSRRGFARGRWARREGASLAAMRASGETERVRRCGAARRFRASSFGQARRAALLRTGSVNFSWSGETRQDNDLAALRGPSVCVDLTLKFDRTWARN